MRDALTEGASGNNRTVEYLLVLLTIECVKKFQNDFLVTMIDTIIKVHRRYRVGLFDIIFNVCTCLLLYIQNYNIPSP